MIDKDFQILKQDVAVLAHRVGMLEKEPARVHQLETTVAQLVAGHESMREDLADVRSIAHETNNSLKTLAEKLSTSARREDVDKLKTTVAVIVAIPGILSGAAALLVIASKFGWITL